MAVYRRYLRQSEGFGAFSASGDRYEIVKSAPAEAAHGSAGAPGGRFLRVETGKTTARRRAPRSGARPRIVKVSSNAQRNFRYLENLILY